MTCAPPPAAGQGIGALVGTLSIQLASTACTLALPVLAPGMPGLALGDVGAYVAMVYVGAAIGSVTGAQAVDRVGPIRASQLALLVQGCALLLILPGETWLRLVGAFLCGLGYGPVNPASSQILARSTPPHRLGLIFSLKQTGVPLAGLFAGLTLPLIASVASWQAAVLAMAAIAALLALACDGLRRRLDITGGPRAPRLPVLAPIRRVLAHPRLRALTLASMLFAIVQLSLSGYLMIYAARELGMGMVQAGVLYGVAQASGAAARLLWGSLADRIGSSLTVLVLIAVLMAAGLLVLGAARPDWGPAPLFAVAVVVGAAAIGWNGVFMSEIARLAAPGDTALVTGGALFFTFAGVIIGPSTFGAVAQVVGMRPGFVGLAAVPVLACVLLLWSRAAGRRRPAG